MIKVAGVAMMAVTLGLGACSTVQGARDRVVRYVSPCRDVQTAQIYFEPNEADVTPEGRAVIVQAAQSAGACRVERVTVLGLADAAGAPNTNLELSRRRAQSVAAVLAQAQLPAAQFEVAAAGQAGALTADGKTAPLRRRVDLTFHLAPR